MPIVLSKVVRVPEAASREITFILLLLHPTNHLALIVYKSFHHPGHICRDTEKCVVYY